MSPMKEVKKGVWIAEEDPFPIIRENLEKKKMSKEITKDLEWKDIAHEIYRVYVFPNNKKITIDNPVYLNVSKSGGHRILDAKNVSHYIPFNWIHLYWETNDDNAFRF